LAWLGKQPLCFVNRKMAHYSKSIPKESKSLENKRRTKPVRQRKSKRVANAIKNLTAQQKSAVKRAAMLKEEAKAKDCVGCCGASRPNRKKGQKQAEAKNTRPKSKLALHTTKKSRSKAKKVVKFHNRHHHNRPWLGHLLSFISTVGIALSVFAAGSQVPCLLGGCSDQIWRQNGTTI
jgi:membrane-bound ClpP family serine protease